jgi:pyruvate formate lyase activating enzyme
MIKGVQKVSLVDYPGVVCATLFTGGCNFRCPWCHNWELVDPVLVAQTPDISDDFIKNFLLKRTGKIQGVCISGGEPTVWGDQLKSFMKWCHENNFLVKLDTNGYLPDVIEDLIKEKLPDYIAMDIKNTYDKYPESAGLPALDYFKIRKSIDLIQESTIAHQFRTTLVPGLVELDDMDNVAEEIGEEIVYQEYRPSRDKALV